MDFDFIFNNFTNNELASSLIKTLIPIGIEIIKRIIKNNHNTKSIEWQILHCIKETHYNACRALNWEYSEDSVFEIANNVAQSSRNIFDYEVINNILSISIGRYVNIEEAQIWINCFYENLSSDKFAHLRNYIFINLTFARQERNNTTEEYIDKFEQIIVAKDEVELRLRDIYIPNSYNLIGDDETHYDLMNLIYSYIHGNINEWIEENNIHLPQYNDDFRDQNNDISGLIIYGHQGTGKSTLISKIIYDYKTNLYLNNYFIHIINFNNIDYRMNTLTPIGICETLRIRTEELNNSLLIIDGFDESGVPAGEAVNIIETLINSLQRYKCKLILTSRPEYINTENLLCTIDIYLQPFSNTQAISWLESYYNIDNSINLERRTKEIISLNKQQAMIVLIPHIFFICIKYNVELSSIKGISHLYYLIFIDNYINILRTKYNLTERNLRTVCTLLRNAITEISFDYIITKKVSDYYLNLKASNYELEKNKIISEFFLNKERDNYTFVHDSIPYFFVAKKIFEDFMNTNNEKNDFFINDINIFCEKSFNIPIGLFEYIKYFVDKDDCNVEEKALETLKSFLSNKTKFINKTTDELQELLDYYYIYFKNLFQILIFLISTKLSAFETYDLFNKLTDDERDNLTYYFNLCDHSMDCINLCALKNIKLNNFNFKGVNLRGKSLLNSTMQNARFDNSILSAAYMLYSDFTLASFNNAHCINTDFTKSLLFGASFKNANLNGCNFTNAVLDYADFRGAKIKKSKFNGASMYGAKFSSEQIGIRFDFDIDYIKHNGILIYKGDDDTPLSENEVENEIKKYHPIGFRKIF